MNFTKLTKEEQLTWVSMVLRAIFSLPVECRGKRQDKRDCRFGRTGRKQYPGINARPGLAVNPSLQITGFSKKHKRRESQIHLSKIQDS